MENPNIYNSDVKLEVTIPLRVSAKLVRYGREMHPGKSEAEVAAYLLEDAMVALGMFTEEQRAKEEGRAPSGGWK